MKYVTWIILGITAIFSILFIGKLIGLFCVAVLLLKIATDIGVFTKVEYHESILEDCKIWYCDYKGNYKDVHQVFKRVGRVFEELKLNSEKYWCFGLYYDDPRKVPVDQTEAIIGILRLNKNKDSIKDINLDENVTLSNKGSIKSFSTLKSVLPFFNFFSVINAVMKYYPDLHKREGTEEFKKSFEKHGTSYDDIKGIFEIYNENIEFHIPLVKFEIKPDNAKATDKKD